MPFHIQRIQTDREREFFAEKAQKQLMIYGIKFRPNKPGSPHLNGKVERSQKTDKSEFYPIIYSLFRESIMHIDHFKEHFQAITENAKAQRLHIACLMSFLARYVRWLQVRKAGLISVNTFLVIMIGLSAITCF